MGHPDLSVEEFVRLEDLRQEPWGYYQFCKAEGVEGMEVQGKQSSGL